MSRLIACDQCGGAIPPHRSNQLLVIVHREGTASEGAVDDERDLCDECLERLARVLHAHGVPAVADMIDSAVATREDA